MEYKETKYNNNLTAEFVESLGWSKYWNRKVPRYYFDNNYLSYWLGVEIESRSKFYYELYTNKLYSKDAGLKLRILVVGKIRDFINKAGFEVR